jgi:hypothetical protein
VPNKGSVADKGAGFAEPRGAAVVRVHGEFKLVATEPVDAGTYLFRIDGERSGSPTRYTVQVDRSTHIDLPPGTRFEDVLDNFFWRFMNHGCEPSAAIRGRDVFSVRPIGALEEITFHYATTEYDMVEPFECRCGAPGCEGLIRGFRHLPAAGRERLRPLLADHLLSIVDGREPEPACR